MRAASAATTAAMVLLHVAVPAHAAYYTWTRGSGATDWATPANWDLAAVPNSGGDTVTFGDTGVGTVPLTGNRTVSALTFANSSAAYTLNNGVSPSSLTVNNGFGSGTIAHTGSGAAMIGAQVPITADNLVVAATGSGILTLTGVLTANLLDKVGGGTVSLGIGGGTGNSNVGVMSVSGGTLRLTAVQPAANSTLVLKGGTLEIRGNSNMNLARPVHVQANSTLVATSAGATTDGTHVLGTLEIGSHTLTVSGANGFDTAFNGGVTLSGSTAAFNVTTATSDLRFHGAVSGASGLLKAGAGTMVLTDTDANTYSGETVVSGGTLLLAKSFGANAIAANVTVDNGGTLQWAASDQIADTATLTLNSGGTMNLAGFTETIAAFVDNGGTTVLGGGGALNVAGGGDIYLTDGTTIASETTPIRRWVSEVNGTITLAGSLSDSDGGGGDGVQARAIVDGNVYILADIGNGGGTGYPLPGVPVTVGSLIDIALVPKAHDACDSTVFTTTVTGPVGGNLTLGGGGAAVAADVNLAGNLVYAGGASAATISGSLALTGATARTIDVADGAAASDVVLGGALTGGGSITKTGPGVLAIAGAQNWSAGSSMTIQGGGVRVDTNAGGQFHARNLAVDAAGGDVSLTVGAGRTATLAAGGGKAIDVSALVLAGSANAWTGPLDVADNMLIVHAPDAERAATLARLQNQARTALNQSGALWTGAGLTSSAAAAADTQHLHALGIVPVGEIYGLGPGQTMIFRGQTVTDDSIVVAYTYFGDADLNGAVNADDFALLDFALQSGGAQGGWLFGDFNYDGVVDRDNDYAILLDSVYGQGVPITPAIQALMASIEARPVPEPSAAGVACAVTAIAGVTRRRRRKCRRTSVAGDAEREMARVNP